MIDDAVPPKVLFSSPRFSKRMSVSLGYMMSNQSCGPIFSMTWSPLDSTVATLGGAMDAAAKKAVRRANAPQWKVAVGVGVGLALAAAPLAFKEVRAREQSVAQMRDAQYDKQGSKDDARDARLKRGKK